MAMAMEMEVGMGTSTAAGVAGTRKAVMATEMVAEMVAETEGMAQGHRQRDMPGKDLAKISAMRPTSTECSNWFAA